MEALRRITNEYNKLKAGAPNQFSCGPVGDDLFQWEATLIGQPGSPYNGGVFFLAIYVPEDYPFEPPNVFFKTPIYHPNVNENGIVGLNLLGSGWTLLITIAKAVEAVNSLLARPKLEDALDPEIAKIYRDDRDAFNALAREWTRKHAM